MASLVLGQGRGGAFLQGRPDGALDGAGPVGEIEPDQARVGPAMINEWRNRAAGYQNRIRSLISVPIPETGDRQRDPRHASLRFYTGGDLGNSAPVRHPGGEGRLSRHARPARTVTPSRDPDSGGAAAGSECPSLPDLAEITGPGQANTAHEDNNEPAPKRRSNREAGGAHASGRSWAACRGVLKYAASTLSMMIPLILLGIFMLSPTGLTLLPAEQVGLGVCLPKPVALGHQYPGIAPGAPWRQPTARFAVRPASIQELRRTARCSATRSARHGRAK